MKVFSKRKWVEKSLELGMSKRDIEKGLDGWVTICDGLPKEVCEKLGYLIWDEACIDEESKTTESKKSKVKIKIFRKEKWLNRGNEDKYNMLKKMAESVGLSHWADEIDGKVVIGNMCEGYFIDNSWCEEIEK